MWKKEDAKPQGLPMLPRLPQFAFEGIGCDACHTPPSSSALPVSNARRGMHQQGIRIKGEVTGSEDLFVDGLVDGKLNLTNGSLTIGPNGTVKADVYAREVIVRGKIEGKLRAGRKCNYGVPGSHWRSADRAAGNRRRCLAEGQSGSGQAACKPSETKATACRGDEQDIGDGCLEFRHRGGLGDELPEITRHWNWKRDEPRCFKAGGSDCAPAKFGTPPVAGEWRERLNPTKRARSNGLKELLWNLDGLGKGKLLDLGRRGNHVEFLHRARIRVSSEDILRGWKQFLTEKRLDCARTHPQSRVWI